VGVFQWTEAYSVHVELFDCQHRVLFVVSEELHQALHVGRGKVVVGRILQRLIDYATTHFADEEVAMALKEYPDLRSHRAQHHALLAQLLHYQKDYQAGKLGVAEKMMPFLQRWLTDHIMQTDKKYGSSLNDDDRVPAFKFGRDETGR
jgi:hemerythrin